MLGCRIICVPRLYIAFAAGRLNRDHSTGSHIWDGRADWQGSKARFGAYPQAEEFRSPGKRVSAASERRPHILPVAEAEAKGT